MLDTAARNGRSESEIIARSGIPIQMGGVTYWFRPLSMDGADAWETQVRDVIGTMFGRLASSTAGMDSVLSLYRATVDGQLDALYAYDDLGHDDGSDHVLPERALLRKAASRDDVDEAIRKLVKHEFPLLKGMDFVQQWVPDELRQLISKELIKLLLPDPSQPAPSTNGSSTNTPRIATRRRSGKH